MEQVDKNVKESLPNWCTDSIEKSTIADTSLGVEFK